MHKKFILYSLFIFNSTTFCQEKITGYNITGECKVVLDDIEGEIYFAQSCFLIKDTKNNEFLRIINSERFVNAIKKIKDKGIEFNQITKFKLYFLGEKKKLAVDEYFEYPIIPVMFSEIIV